MDFITKPVQSGEIPSRVASHLQQARQKRKLEERTEELKAMNESMTGRELRVLELKREVNDLAMEIGRQPPYDEVDYS